MRTLLSLTLALTGCGSFTVTTDVPEQLVESMHAAETPEARGVLALLNHPATTKLVLESDVGITARAARNIVEHRNGADGEAGTDDDDRFDTIEEVDDVPQVGDATLEAILAYARFQPQARSTSPMRSRSSSPSTSSVSGRSPGARGGSSSARSATPSTTTPRPRTGGRTTSAPRLCSGSRCETSSSAT